jgi:hypothetical protein
MTVEDAIQLAQQKPALPPSINQITDTLNYSPDPRYILSGIDVGSSRVDLQACKLEYSIVSPK